jgi:hypothetical protein
MARGAREKARCVSTPLAIEEPTLIIGSCLCSCGGYLRRTDHHRLRGGGFAIVARCIK